MKRYDRICSVIFFVLAGVLIWQSLLIPVGRFGKPGPGFLPLMIGVMLALLSALLWIEAGLRKPSQARVAFFVGEGKWPSVLLTVSLLLAYALLIEFLGFILCSLLLLLLLFRFVGRQKWWLVLTETVLVTLAAHVIFKVGLKVQLPGGLFRI
jgi:putative tricarboxylic transport membrane protein